MQLIEGNIYVSVSELEGYGVPSNSIWRGVHRARKNFDRGVGYSDSWAHTPDPSDRRRVLIRLDSIPARTRKKYNIPTVEEAREMLANASAQQQQAQVEAQQMSRQAAVRQAADEGYTAWYGWYANPHKYAGARHSGYAPATARELARAAAVAEYCMSQVLYKSRADLKEAEALLPAVQACQLRYLKLSSLHYFVQKLKACQRNGIFQTIRPPREGTKNAAAQNRRYDERHRYIAEELYSRASKPSSYYIWQSMQYVCEQQGLACPSESWIKQYLEQTEVKNRCERRRMGQRYFQQRQGGYADRVMALAPGDQWQEDGTRLMLICKDRKGQPSYKWIYVVMDVYSGMILGWALSDTEDRYVRLHALKMACDRVGYTPAELIHDGHSHGLTDEIKRMEDALARNGTTVTVAPAGQPQYKGHVERWFESFQSRYLKQAPTGVGEGIVSTRAHGRVSEEELARIYSDKQNLPGEDAVAKQVAELVNLYNYESYRGRPAPAKLHEEHRPHARELGLMERALAFWPCRTVKMQRSELRLEIRKQEYKYVPASAAVGTVNELKQRLNGERVRLHYDPQQPAAEVQLFDPETDQYLGTAQPKEKINGNKALQTEADQQALARVSAINNAYEDHLTQEQEQLREAAGGEELDGVIQESMNWRIARKETLAQSELAWDKQYLAEHAGWSEQEANEEEPVPAGRQAPELKQPRKRKRRGLYDAEGSLDTVKPSNDQTSKQ